MEAYLPRRQQRERWKQYFEEILNRPVPDNCITDDDIELEPDPVIDNMSTSYTTRAEVQWGSWTMANLVVWSYSWIAKSRHTYNNWLACQIVESWLWRSTKGMEAGDYCQASQERSLNKLWELERYHTTIVPRKIFLRVLRDHTRRRSTTAEQIYILRNIIAQVMEWYSLGNICGWSFKKAFDSVHRESLWRIMTSYGTPQIWWQ